ncbi:hypothetical protein GCM10023238_39050 [Streptomyces heliomycini]
MIFPRWEGSSRGGYQRKVRMRIAWRSRAAWRGALDPLAQVAGLGEFAQERARRTPNALALGLRGSVSRAVTERLVVLLSILTHHPSRHLPTFPRTERFVCFNCQEVSGGCGGWARRVRGHRAHRGRGVGGGGGFWGVGG